MSIPALQQYYLRPDRTALVALAAAEAEAAKVAKAHAAAQRESTAAATAMLGGSAERTGSPAPVGTSASMQQQQQRAAEVPRATAQVQCARQLPNGVPLARLEINRVTHDTSRSRIAASKKGGADGVCGGGGHGAACTLASETSMRSAGRCDGAPMQARSPRQRAAAAAAAAKAAHDAAAAAAEQAGLAPPDCGAAVDAAIASLGGAAVASVGASTSEPLLDGNFFLAMKVRAVL